MVLSSYDRAHDPPNKSFEEHQLPTSNMNYISISLCSTLEMQNFMSSVLSIYIFFYLFT